MTIKIDYFSDTNIIPSEEMLKYMMKAKVGNEAAGEDPTVNQLIEKVCHLLGKESAIFLPTGTMANTIAFRVHCDRPGDIVVLDETSHPLKVQSGSISGLAGATPYPISGIRGIYTKKQIEPIIKKGGGRNLPRIRLISIEQTTNFGGGAVWPIEQIEEVCSFARANQVRPHLDGARLFNAHVATQIPIKEYAKHFDSVYLDFAKGLGAPIGAILAGNRAFIEEAWYYKFQQGGAMHQSGILAASCIYALDNNIPKLLDDHKKSAMLAKGLSGISQIDIQPKDYLTNILFFKLQKTKFTVETFIQALRKENIRMLAMEDKIRAIVHMGISEEDIKNTISVISKILCI
ncbi:MAG: low specificity L-threonine aldolase [Candidatus Midichloriaceae bacterium]|jgi:threonine aldolase|nr:low specificity L-threonine aldolase [Candidatus Midichloriaceae bacterium]